MKFKGLRGKVYGKLIRRLYLQTMAVLGASAIFIFTLRSALRGKFADGIVDLISSVRNISWDEAKEFYQYTIRNNLDTIIIAAVVVCFFIFFRLSLSWFTRYFDQIAEGVDKLAQETEDRISMSPELEFMETKLNEVKDKLAMRSEQARVAEQRKNELVVYLAHDVKTPLTSVIGYLSLLNEHDDMPPEQRRQYLCIALEKAHRLKLLVNEFFEVTRYNYQSALEKQPVDLCYMLVQIADELYPQLKECGKQVRLNMAEDAVVPGDSEKLARVFNNLLKNAITYSEENSTIDIFIRHKPEQVSIAFRNEGSIPGRQLELVFDKFYRLDKARSSHTGGSGLGLAIAKDIVEMHGGSIRAESSDGFTEFTVTLPTGAGSV